MKKLKLSWWDRVALWLGYSIYYSCNTCGATVEHDDLQLHGNWHTDLANGDFK